MTLKDRLAEMKRDWSLPSLSSHIDDKQVVALLECAEALDTIRRICGNSLDGCSCPEHYDEDGIEHLQDCPVSIAEIARPILANLARSMGAE